MTAGTVRLTTWSPSAPLGAADAMSVAAAWLGDGACALVATRSSFTAWRLGGGRWSEIGTESELAAPPADEAWEIRAFSPTGEVRFVNGASPVAISTGADGPADWRPDPDRVEISDQIEQRYLLARGGQLIAQELVASGTLGNARVECELYIAMTDENE